MAIEITSRQDAENTMILALTPVGASLFRGKLIDRGRLVYMGGGSVYSCCRCRGRDQYRGPVTPGRKHSYLQ